MKAIDLYAAHALGALIQLHEAPMTEAEVDGIVHEARRMATELAEQMCAHIACSIVDGRCERCSRARVKVPPPPPADMGPPKRIG